MKVRLDVNLAGFGKSWDAILETVREGTRRAARDAHEHAGERAVTFLIDSVYATEPGNVYERTERALGLVHAYLDPDGADWVLTVESTAPYAAQIEQGNRLDWFDQQRVTGEAFIPQISLEELQTLMLTLGEELGAELHPGAFFQRSGQNYQEPGPHVTPAAVAGAYRFAEGLEAAWKRAARLP